MYSSAGDFCTIKGLHCWNTGPSLSVATHVTAVFLFLMFTVGHFKQWWDWERSTMNVEHEISLLVEEIRRLGTKNADGQVSVKFGVLFADEKCANLFEALVGTLKAAKRRKIVTYQGELLLQGVHDNVDIMLLQD